MFTDADRRQLAERGIPEAEARLQLERLGGPPPHTRLERACTVGDGIERWSTAERDRHAAAADARLAAGGVSAFIPASGAATRMFKELLAWASRPGDLPLGELESAAAAGDRDAAATLAWWRARERFAFWPELSRRVGSGGGNGPLRPWLEQLLGPAGLDYAARPKGLLAFHRDGARVRTAFDEHLAEAVGLLAGADGGCALHFTVSPEHASAFAAHLAAVRGTLEAGGARFAVTFSTQEPATDTLAAEPGGGPFRDERGALVFRPAGHGALIRNLAHSRGDLVFIKNIDNVTTGARQSETLRWARALVGRLVTLEREAHTLAARVAAGDAGADAAAQAWFAHELGVEVRTHGAALAARLDRPLRVCGMVPNTGEPGGGPFWVRDGAGELTAQIVESVQVDAADPEQRARFAAATHFNPVFMACALRDRDGQPHDLDAAVDPAAAIVTRKSHLGRELLALERPGLWNGAMAGWNSRFVEVPIAVFNPVKNVLDLLRPEHQG